MSDGRSMAALTALLGGMLSSEARPLPTGIDVGELVSLMHRHRVVILCGGQWDRLCRQGLAPRVPPQMAGAARIAHMRALSSAGFLIALARRLDEAAIGWIPLKGPALSSLIHGEPCARVARDIDVLVDRARIDDAVAIATSLGWRATDGWKRAAALTGKYDLELAPSRPGQPILEVHGAVGAQHSGFSWSPLDDATQSVTVHDTAMRMPDRRTLAAYLAWHGARHFWFRLNWLVDLAALLRDEDDGGALMARARQLGAERSLRAGMMLVERLLATAMPDVPPPTPRMKAAAERLAAWGEERIGLDPEHRRVAARPWSFLWTTREWRVDDRPLRQVPSAFASLWRPREPDARRLGLGAPLFLHILARPFLLARRVAADLARRGDRRGT